MGFEMQGIVFCLAVGVPELIQSLILLLAGRVFQHSGVEGVIDGPFFCQFVRHYDDESGSITLTPPALVKIFRIDCAGM